MELDRTTTVNLLYDCYGQLLTRRQQEVMSLYHAENLSLAEIAGEFCISRQGVYDTLKNAEKSLNHYEETLGLVKRLTESRKAIRGIDRILDEMLADHAADKPLSARLETIKAMIDQLDQ